MGSNVEKIRHALSLLQSLMDGQSADIRNADIEKMTHLPRKTVRRIMDNNSILPRASGERHFLLDKRTPVRYKNGARGPSELDEEKDRGRHGVRRSRHPGKVPEDYSG